MFRKVLLPTDFSEGYCRAVLQFERMNEMRVGEVILLHVVDEGTLEELMDGYSLFYGDEEKELKDIEERLKEVAMEKLLERMDEIKRAFRAEKVTPMVRFGVPWEEIVKVAEEEDVSLIILPSHGKLGFSHESLGSTTMRVLKKTKRPVLLIKTHEEV
ncbi:universal stress protein [Thermococcus pacificus]|uniref:Universal stress protein n=1 Tax=Thermococcus pacificus TaxID=71998 RepID=A0A218P7J6_9EURY|nr:universal stress protein [Thermococcus pacificus]ASJ06761.1 universal stress protein [Thermococcus pacificus]